jgi:serine/threonine-protein kinase ATR
MSCLRRLVNHMELDQEVKLEQTAAGDWCLQSLRSSSRDLKIAAVNTLQAYVNRNGNANHPIVRSNRAAALDFLNTLWQQGEVAKQETVILSLARMAHVVQDEELNIILIRLVEYLGHTNSYISELAYAEIQHLAECLQTSVWLLCRPFWRTLGIVFAKSLMSRRDIARKLCELLGMDMSGLMTHAAEYALPYLVLHKARDVVLEFAKSDEQSGLPFDQFTVKPHRMAVRVAVLSFLLVQPFSDPEQAIINLLAGISEEFGKTDLSSWVVLNSIEIACELLKAIGDTGEGKSSRVYQALQLLAQLVGRQRGPSSGAKRTDSIGAFLETNILAIVSNFTVLLNDLEAKESKVEKRRCLAALGEAVKLGRSRIVRALPQICACLRSGLDDRALCDAAFSGWAAMIRGLKKDDLASLIDQTLAIIVQTWDKFDSRSQKLAYDVVAELLEKHSDLLEESFSTMPSLASIPEMADLEDAMLKLKNRMDERQQLVAYCSRLRHENIAVVEQALVELVPVLHQKQQLLHRSILREQPDEFIAELTRALLDCCVKFNASNEVVTLCGQALGCIGCLDASKIDSVRDRKSMIVPDNFAKASEVVSWIFFFLEHVLVKAFLSANTTRAQGFLGWAMQEFLKACDLDGTDSPTSQAAIELFQKLPPSFQNVLTPFLNSRYTVQDQRDPEKNHYPIFVPGMKHRDWLRTITLDFLHRGSGRLNVEVVFAISCRIIHGQDISIPSFLLPYALANLIVSGIAQDSQDIITEINCVLNQSLEHVDAQVQSEIKLCSQTIFEVLDYVSTWQQRRRKLHAFTLARSDRQLDDPALRTVAAQIQSVDSVLEQIAPDVLARRALECQSYSRALFHWEQHIRNITQNKVENIESELQRLQDIYAQIDEPDGIEGLSTQIHVLDIEQQVLEHKKAGRWTAAQSWYEMELVAHPDDTDVQKNLMMCLKESGQYDALIHQFDGIRSRNGLSSAALAPFAIEAAWATSRWDLLGKYVPYEGGYDFASSIAESMLAVKDSERVKADELALRLFQKTAQELNASNVSSFQASHDTLLRLHVLHDVRAIAECRETDRVALLAVLEGRLDVLGSNVADKQYLLGIRRAIMSLRPDVFTQLDIATAWLSSAKLARKARSMTQAFHAVLRASMLGDKSAAIEHAKLMWLEGHYPKAIQTLKGAIESGAFVAHNHAAESLSTTMSAEQQHSQNEVMAKAYVLLGKWLAQAGQTQSEVIRMTFGQATKTFTRGERGWYHMGRYYNRTLDSERTMPPGKESQPYLTGETTKHVIENYMRSLFNGSKYVFQTLPKVLTLWFELVDAAELAKDDRRGNHEFHVKVNSQRKRIIEETNAQIKKYADTILPQLVARICHTNKIVQEILINMVVRVARAFPQQAYWTLLAVVESQQKERALKGVQIFNKLIEVTKKSNKDSAVSAAELRSMYTNGHKLVKELLRISEFSIPGKPNKISLSRELGFNSKIAPSRLVVPSQACLIPSMPTNFEPAQLKAFRPFAKEAITIAGFEDEALVLNSLQKPRRLTIRGSDGNTYKVLAKPKDDLRKDQRLMEFNNMINRFLKRDVDAAKRRLYIRTYAVIPMNEECGLIEWVDNLKTFRDIILRLYKEKSISPNYAEIRNLLEESAQNNCEKAHYFPQKVLAMFPPVFHEWFVESFPDPSAWFNARLRYTRSAAVMSIVGHVLGLGDRHGENILFEEDNGGTLHVDFNCLFDKGLTFEKPEMVPFRLTHNMVNAMGAYGYEGPFRRCCEITLQLLRGNEDALMTILETFLHDPTTDFINAAGRKKKVVPGVPSTPMEVLDGVRGKVRGFLTGESVPLSVGGYVNEMISRAVDEKNLCQMYIGWCAFF